MFCPAVPRTDATTNDKAGLLAFGSIYCPRLPTAVGGSGCLRMSSPITAAGPLPFFTGFPFNLIAALCIGYPGKCQAIQVENSVLFAEFQTNSASCRPVCVELD